MRALVLFILPVGLFAADDSFLLRGATVHTMAGADIENGSVLVRAGKIVGVGKNLPAPKDTKIIDGKGLHVYPGMIDAATEVGLVEVNSIRETADTTEIGRFNPQLVALTAVNPSSQHITVTRANGITTVATMPQGQLIAGQVSLIHLDGWTTEEMGVSPKAALHLRMPVLRVGGPPAPREEPPGSGASSSDTFAGAKQNFEKQMAELNEFFESARRYQQAKEVRAPGFLVDLKLEAIIPVLEQK